MSWQGSNGSNTKGFFGGCLSANASTADGTPRSYLSKLMLPPAALADGAGIALLMLQLPQLLQLQLPLLPQLRAGFELSATVIVFLRNDTSRF